MKIFVFVIYVCTFSASGAKESSTSLVLVRRASRLAPLKQKIDSPIPLLLPYHLRATLFVSLTKGKRPSHVITFARERCDVYIEEVDYLITKAVPACFIKPSFRVSNVSEDRNLSSEQSLA